MRLEQIVPGRRRPTAWWVPCSRGTSGRRRALVEGPPADGGRPGRVGDGRRGVRRRGRGPVTVLVLEPGDLHEDEAALRLAAAVGRPGAGERGPGESRVDLVAAADGVLHVRVRELELINRIDPLEVFTAFDGSVVSAGQLVASVKVAPHVVPEEVVEAGVRHRRLAEQRPLVRVAPFVARRVGVLVKESIRAADRARFERSVARQGRAAGSR